MVYRNSRGELIVNRSVHDNTTMLLFIVEVWATEDNDQDNDNGENDDDDDDIYSTEMTTCNAEGCTIIGPYISDYEGIYLN